MIVSTSFKRPSFEVNEHIWKDEVVIPQSAKPTIELMMARAFQRVLRGRADTGSVRMDWTTPEIAKEPVVVALDD
jgi:hypothetical protein